MACNCEFTPYDENDPEYGEESWHYRRRCRNCGMTWLSTHCKHDGIQPPCPECGVVPAAEDN